MRTVVSRGMSVVAALLAIVATAAAASTARAGTAAGSPPPAARGTSTSTAIPRQLIVPDLFAAVPTGLSRAQIIAIEKLPGVRAVLVVDGGSITVDGRPADVIGVRPQQFRSWTPPSTAADPAVWTALGRGELVPDTALTRRLRARPGGSYPVTGASRARLRFGVATNLGINGVDAVVDHSVATRLGLVKNLAVVINAPGADLRALMSRVRAVLGAHGRVVSLQPTVTKVTTLPVTTAPAATASSNGRPTTYLMLYQESAARYCPGLSWTILAAIGEVESGNGANMGPSSAGALGPMQFLPSTWREWGIDGFGETGPPNIMDPLDAVPSAAVYLCAYGAAQGGSALYHAIWEYNHADWYVNEVLAIAKEYAQDYG